MGVHINFLGEMKDEVAIRVVRTGPVNLFFRGPFDDYTTEILLLFFFISSRLALGDHPAQSKVSKKLSFYKILFYFVLSAGP
jgi:hypothetical protein